MAFAATRSSDLALDGGAPVRTAPLPPWPHHDEDEQRAVLEVLRSGRVNYWGGTHGRAFERDYAARVGVAHGVACGNGTLALELCLRALGIGPGDEVVVTPRSFFASASVVLLVGATPVFADVDADSEAITAETIARVLTPATRAVLPVHLNGYPADMAAIADLAAAHGLAIIEDCAQAHGATLDGREIGSFGEASAFSFCTDKIISAGGEGGMALFRDRGAFDIAWSYKDHGKDHDAMLVPDPAPGFKWQHERIGSNFRMPEMNAAIGRLQLGRLEAMTDARRRNAAGLEAALIGFDAVRLPVVPERVGHARYKFSFFVRPEALAVGWDRERIIAALEAEGVPARSGGCPEIYRQPVFAGTELSNLRLPVAHELGQTSLMLPVHPTLADSDIADMAEALDKVFSAAMA